MAGDCSQSCLFRTRAVSQSPHDRQAQRRCSRGRHILLTFPVKFPLCLPLLLPVSALPLRPSHEAGADDNGDVIPPLPGDVSNCTLCASGCVCVSVSSRSVFFTQTNKAIKEEEERVSVMERVQKLPAQNCFIMTLMQRTQNYLTLRPR